MMTRLRLPVAIAALVLVAAVIGWGIFQRPAAPALTQDQIDTTMAQAESAYADTDYPRVVTLLTELGEAGVPLAQYRLGMMYKNGIGVEADEAASVSWFSQAVEAGFPDARAPLGEIYLGRAVEAATLEEGLPWYEQAAELGHPAATAVLGSYYLSGTGVPQDTDRGIALLRTAAEDGDPRAQTNLGYAYATGTGVVADDTQAFRWYREAAEAGLVRAQAVVGLFYETGRGTGVDLAEAVRWYVNAYEAGAPGVGVRLGDMVTSGALEAPVTGQVAAWVADAGRAGHDGAVAWLEAAAETGNPAVLTIIGGLYDAGEVLPQNSALALDCYQRGAEGGDADAQLALARRYATGEGVDQDYVPAHVWANRAAAAGAEGAAEERAVFAQFLTPESLAEAQSRATAWRAAHREP